METKKYRSRIKLERYFFWCIYTSIADTLTISIRFQNFCFTFHVSYFVIKQLNINHLWKWNIWLGCFILSFMFHFSNLCGSALSLPQCFWIAPTVFLNRFHSVFVFLPQCFLNEILKLKMKHKSRMFQPSKVLIINRLKLKNETWKQKMQ